MRAEEEIVEKAHSRRPVFLAQDVPRPKHEIDERENRVDDHVGQKHESEKRRPGRIDQVQVRMNIAPGGSVPFDVEAAVFVDRAPQVPGVLLSQAGIEGGVRHIQPCSQLFCEPSHPAPEYWLAAPELLCWIAIRSAARASDRCGSPAPPEHTPPTRRPRPVQSPPWRSSPDRSPIIRTVAPSPGESAPAPPALR